MSDLITAKMIEQAMFSSGLIVTINQAGILSAKLNAQIKPKLDKIDELIEDIEGAIGCTDGDDIRTHIEEALALYRGGE